MLYTSLEFIGFVLIGMLVYYLLPEKLQRFWLLLLNIIFYLSSDIRYALFLLFSIVTTFWAGIGMEKYPKHKKSVLVSVCIANIGLLLVTKWGAYLASLMGSVLSAPSLMEMNLIVPLGISFYALQAVSYCADVYREKHPAEKSFVNYTLYMSFFPTIVQGPISRFDQLSTQLCQAHRFDYTKIKFGMQLALWGFFKKLVIADRTGIFVNQVFSGYGEYNGVMLVLAAVLYSVQLYTDFSGCVDVCRGVAQMFGIELLNNFNHPYFAASIKEFWNKWHISLSSWLKDYVYIPLGGNRKGRFRKYVNLLAVFFVSGIWHGVGFQYIVWGCLHGFYQIVEDILWKNRKHSEKSILSRTGGRIATFLLVTLAWVFFRSASVADAVGFLQRLFVDFRISDLMDGSLLSAGLDEKDFTVLAAAVMVLLLVSALQKRFSLRQRIEKLPLLVRWLVYYLAVLSVVVFGVYGPGYDAAQFIYMQF